MEKILVDFGPIIAIDMQKIELMIHNKDWGVATSDFLPESRLLLENSFESGVIILNVSNRFSQTSLYVIIIFILEDPRLRDVTVL